MSQRILLSKVRSLQRFPIHRFKSLLKVAGSSLQRSQYEARRTQLWRYISIQRLSFLDFTYSFIEVVFWSILEPLLDVVNACLNVMLPAIQMIFTLSVFVWTRVRNFACRISILITTHHLLTLWIFLHYDQMLICEAPVLFTHTSTR